jgi:hypothetical protein
MAVREDAVNQSRSERMEWSAIRDYLAMTEKRAQSAELILNQVREVLKEHRDYDRFELIETLEGIVNEE